MATLLSDLPIMVSQSVDPTTQRNIVNDCPTLYQLLRRLEGYMTNLLGHHWHGYNNSTHVRIDEFIDETGELKDALAECGMGIYGVMPLGFTSIESNNWEVLSLMQTVITDVTSVHDQLDNDPRNYGLINAMEDYLEKANRIKYFTYLALQSTRS